ncbi:MAG: hypothetical protein K0Q89_3124 [Thermomicrobiales bacterium]|nr:hypothetical protein [Thermomicrobiales bacterium]
MLRRSWTLALEASITRPELVPAGSAASTIANRIWGEESWLIWQHPRESWSDVAFELPMEEIAVEPDQIHVALRRQLEPQRQRSSATWPGSMPDVEFVVGPVGGDGPPCADGDGDHAAPTELNEAEIRRLVATLGVPRARLEEIPAKGI